MENKKKLMNIIKHIKKYSNCNVLNEKFVDYDSETFSILKIGKVKVC